jgi:DNA-binding GntR family transcriptional regulator
MADDMTNNTDDAGGKPRGKRSAKVKGERLGQNRDCYAQLRRLLIHMQIRPGSRLVEAEWSKRLNVHRTALREAMSMLAHEGLLRRGERGGYFAPLFEQRDLDEIWAVRAILEAGAVRQLSERRPADLNLKPLENAIDAMEQMLDEGYELGFIEADRRFHSLLVELSGNQRLIELYKRAPLPLMASPLPDPEARHTAMQKTVGEHQEIAKLIREQRTAEAIERLQEHLHQAHRPTPVY